MTTPKDIPLLEYFAAHEQLSDYDDPRVDLPEKLSLELAGPMPENLVEKVGWIARLRAKLRFIRAQAMVEEAERRKATTPETYARLAEQAIPKTTGLSFSEALEAMKQGKKVRRACWYSKDLCISISGKTIMQHESDSGFISSGMLNENLLAGDWEIFQ